MDFVATAKPYQLSRKNIVCKNDFVSAYERSDESIPKVGMPCLFSEINTTLGMKERPYDTSFLIGE